MFVSRLQKYTLEEIKEIISKSKSYAEVIRSIGLIPAGGNYKTLQSFVHEYRIDTSHFLGSAWGRGNQLDYLHNSNRKSLEDVFSGKVAYKSSHKLRLRLIKEGYFEHKCYKCGLKEWQGHEIPLELEHINGDHCDNSLENLIILCPNCHAQTETYAGKNKKRRLG
jgi:5-methylcytosine-specific restriction endonuclease McrA